jgi:hypothetical protein
VPFFLSCGFAGLAAAGLPGVIWVVVVGCLVVGAGGDEGSFDVGEEWPFVSGTSVGEAVVSASCGSELVGGMASPSMSEGGDIFDGRSRPRTGSVMRL